MDDQATGFRIGELARITGLPVKTIRFYSDRGLVPPVERTGAGYRVYDERALLQLELVRALRELGAGLDDIERVLARDLDLSALVRMQIEAVEAQLQVLRLRRAALRAIDAGDYTNQELKRMTKLIKTSDEERKRVVEDFLDEVLGGLEVDPGLEARLRAGLPELPDDPAPEQIEAWVELAELCRDPGFRARIRAMARARPPRRPTARPCALRRASWRSAATRRSGRASSPIRRRQSRSSPRSCGRSASSTRPPSAHSSRIASSRAPIRAPSATGSSSP